MRRCIRVEDALGEPSPRGIDFQRPPDGGDDEQPEGSRTKHDRTGYSNEGWDYKRHAAEKYEQYQRNQSRNDHGGWENKHFKQGNAENWGDHEERGHSDPQKNWERDQENSTGGWDQYEQQGDEGSEAQISELFGEGRDDSERLGGGSNTDEKEGDEGDEGSRGEAGNEQDGSGWEKQQPEETSREEWEPYPEQDDKDHEYYWAAMYGGGRTLSGNTPKATSNLSNQKKENVTPTGVVNEADGDDETITQHDLEDSDGNAGGCEGQQDGQADENAHDPVESGVEETAKKEEDAAEGKTKES